jgi:hypothetical protein
MMTTHWEIEHDLHSSGRTHVPTYHLGLLLNLTRQSHQARTPWVELLLMCAVCVCTNAHTCTCIRACVYARECVYVHVCMCVYASVNV